MKLFLRIFLTVALACVLWSLLGNMDDGVDGPQDGGSLLDPEEGEGSGVRGANDGPSGVGDGPRGAGGAATAAGGDTSPASTDTFELLGRVVDQRRLPIADAAVQLRIGAGTPLRATTDADGIYRFPLSLRRGVPARRGALVARRKGYGAGTGMVWLRAAGAEAVAAIVLEPAHPLRVRVEVDGKPSAFATVAVARRAGGSLTPLASGSSDSAGIAGFDGLAAGLYEVLATLPGRGRGTQKVRLPQAQGDVAVVALGSERYLDVIVEDARTRRPVSGATVTIGDKLTLPAPNGPGYLPSLPTLSTNAQGRVSVRGLGEAETIYANAEAPGYAVSVWWQAHGQRADPGVNEIRVRLQRQRTVTFPIYEGEGGVPADGTALRVDAANRGSTTASGNAHGRIEGSYAIVEGLPQAALAGVLVAPDGRQARFRAPVGVDAGGAIEFLAARSVRVRVVEPDGTAVAGLGVRLNPLDGTGQVEPATTDADGVAVFERVAATKAGVHVRSGDSPWGGPLLGRLDLEDGQEQYELELEASVGFRLLLRIDGEPALPAYYTLVVAGQRVPLDEVVEDAQAGTLEVNVRPPPGDGPITVTLHATGYLPERLELDSRNAGGSPIELDLKRAGELVARVVPPADGQYSLALQRYSAATKRWVAFVSAPGPGLRPEPAGDGIHRYPGLDAGRYRVVEARSGYESRAVDVRLGMAPAEVAVDLSTSVQITGRVTAPAGTSLTRARVLVEGRDDPSNGWTGARVGGDGVYRLRALAGQTLRLRVTHPTLSAAARGGSATVVAGGKGPELRLEAGAQATFRVAGLASGSVGTASIAGTGGGVEVKLYKGAVGAELVLSVQPERAAGTYTFGGYTPGTYTLWIAHGTQHPPTIRAGVSLAAGLTDLGTITPAQGTTLILELAGGAGSSPTGIWASVTALGTPSYARSASGGPDGSVLTVPGLGKGSFRVLVRASSARGTRVLHDGTVRLDGTGEHRLRVGGR